jgi:glycerol uptake facilitator protein
MSPLLAELHGTAILVMLGDGVVANVVLQRTKGNDSGWIVITTGWALAVTIAVYCVGSVSGAHLNPAVTIGLATIGTFPWANVPGYIAAQIAGGILGGIIVWLAYLPHWAATSSPRSPADSSARSSCGWRISRTGRPPPIPRRSSPSSARRRQSATRART